MYIIRKYEAKDADQVRKICVEVADDNWQKNPIFRQALLDVFCNYYIEQEPNNCLVVVDEQDFVRGYCLCSESFDRFREVFPKQYLKTLNPVTKGMGKATMKSLEPYAEDYPAHLHIDLLADCRGQGAGRKLIDTLCINLQAKHVKGLMLDVATDNTGAQAFYEKCGFQVLQSNPQEILMGQRL